MGKCGKVIAWVGCGIVAAVIAGYSIYAGIIDKPHIINGPADVEGIKIERLYAQLPFEGKLWWPWYNPKGKAEVTIDPSLTIVDNNLIKEGLDEIIASFPNGTRIKFSGGTFSDEKGEHQFKPYFFHGLLQENVVVIQELYNKIQDKYFPLESIIQKPKK